MTGTSAIGRLRSAFFENARLKLLSFVIALGLYSLVHGSTDAQRTVLVDLVFLLPPESANRVLVNQLPPQVRVTLRGRHALLDDLRADEIGNLQLDLHEGTSSRALLDAHMVHVPPGIRVEQIDPPLLDFQWEDVVSQDVPVQVGVMGTPASSFVVRGVPIAAPRAVTVRGPRSEVRVLQHLRADPFDVTGLTEGRHVRHLALDRAPGRIKLTATAVDVTTEIAREVTQRVFPRVPVAIVGIVKAKAQPAEVDVRLVCPPEIINPLRPEQVIAAVTVVSTLPSSSESLPVQVRIAGCEAAVVPPNVIVRW